MVSVLCLSLARGHGGDGGAARGADESLLREKILYVLGDSAPLSGDYKGLNWRMKGSKVVSDISGLGIWQSAAWSLPAPARKMLKGLGESVNKRGAG